MWAPLLFNLATSVLVSNPDKLAKTPENPPDDGAARLYERTSAAARCECKEGAMTSAIRWEPIEDLKAIRDMVERTLIRPLVNLPLVTIMDVQILGARHPLDVYETEDGYVAEVEAPGFMADEIVVSVTGLKLTVEGKRAVEGRAYTHHESGMGRLKRTFRVPLGVAVDGITATLDHGVLVLTMPKIQDLPQAVDEAELSEGES